MNEPRPPLDEFLEWKQHPFTERFFRYLGLVVEDAKEGWVKEQFVGATLDQWALQNAKALGGASILNELMKVDYQDIVDAETEARERGK